MKQSWRWFGPLDRIELPEIAQSGAHGIVTALHEVPAGEVWSRAAIEARKQLIEGQPALGLDWTVVESLPVHEDIKRGSGDLAQRFGAYRQSLSNLAACGIRTVCYNFMPLLDWTRTDLAASRRGGARALRFSAVRMAAFEIHILGRPGAAADYPQAVRAEADRWNAQADEGARGALLASIMAGLPGAYDRYDIAGLRTALARYRGLGRAELKANFARFLAEVTPCAQDLGMRLCVHPDDPPRDILGLPRIVSDEADIAWVLGQQDSEANGLTLCSGSLGANPANDVPAIARRFATRIHFAHLRNVTKDADGSFEEAEHLGGDIDMVALVAVLLAEERRRRAEGRQDAEIPFRPDHGHEIAGDIGRGTHPGYPLIGRLRGLAELRGVITALQHRETRHG